MMDKLQLRLSEDNDIRFDVTITSDTHVPDGPTVDVRFICESNDVEFCFNGKALDDGTVQIVVPPMKGIINEGTYRSRLEVIVDDRRFTPMRLTTEFNEPVKVVAEGVRVVNERSKAAVSVNRISSPRTNVDVRRVSVSNNSETHVSNSGTSTPRIKSHKKRTNNVRCDKQDNDINKKVDALLDDI